MHPMDKRRARAALVITAAIHLLHDGLSSFLYVLFPIWQVEFTLSFAVIGFLRASYSGSLALFQIPAGYLAERWGEARVLATGTALTALGFFALGAVGGVATLLVVLVAAGLGSGTQHPLGASLVSRAYEGGHQRFALGTFNFSGDLGKMLFPTCATFLFAWVGWRAATQGVGLLTAASAVAALAGLGWLSRASESPGKKRPIPEGAKSGWGIRNHRGFQVLTGIHGIDDGSRTVFLTFLPFLLLDKGANMELTGLAFGLLLGGGAAGKFFCGLLAERLGVIRTVILTEAATAGGTLLLLVLPLTPAMILLPVLGVMLNGTSSVLYGTVPDFVIPERRSRAYGLFYTIGIGCGAAFPPFFGLLSDWTGVRIAFVVLTGVVALTIPLAGILRGSLREKR
jgi:FSR family fosmidomycin resistance protein-like MFS transporter